MEEEKTCCEKFATPHEPIGGVEDGSHSIQFTCWETNKCFVVYYNPGTPISDDFLSGVIGRALSVCHGCKKMKPAPDNADSSP